MDSPLLSINDTQASIGLQHLQIRQPRYAPTALQPPLLPQQNALDILAAQLDSQLHLIIAMQARIAELERRTWWSMLKDQVRSWFRR